MESKKISDNFSDLTDNVREYVQLKIDLLKLTFTEKLARIASLLILSILMFMILIMILLFFSLAFILWFRESGGQAYIGALIVAIFYLLIGGVVFLFRKSFFINPIIAQLSKIFINEEDENE